MKKTLLALSTVALLAGTTMASAQFYDDPPGWAFQRRGIIDSTGQNPNTYGRYHGGYRAYAYRGPAVVPAPRYHRRYRSYGWDNPPGALFQDQGIDDSAGIDPLRRW
jgi:hypothetical protein